MPIFLPLLDTQPPQILSALERIGPVIHTVNSFNPDNIPHESYLLVDHADTDQLIFWLNAGVDKIIVPLSQVLGVIGQIPPERLLVTINVENVTAISDRVREGVSGVLIKTPTIDLDLISSMARFFEGSTILVLPTSDINYSPSLIRNILGINSTLVIPVSNLTVHASSAKQINLVDAFLAPLLSDRPDGLFPTVVSSETGHTLGLVYSSRQSVTESIVTGKGVYQSRKHGLWRKGESSGAVQDVISIRLDCDADSLEFRVVQHGSGFCHLNRLSCFGHAKGFAALERTLKSRLESAPEGSYTKRLFNDPVLLRSKIMEEADELCKANTTEEIAFEAADLAYFALTKCVAAGVSIEDIEKSLDLKAKRATRRTGDAKPQWSVKTQEVRPALPNNSDTIRMRTYELSQLAPEERAKLLRRPVLKSDEMIAKVRPIVEDVRTRGDAALLELTAKFDKAKLTSTVINPPFAPESMQIADDVRRSIDVAYANIRKFHEAQLDNKTLVVETMPGVVCSRFAKPIARVGLYVPGGTAILPSTALMLGIPAQVAGCQKIVLATPPRPDGTISPEVMYVAHLVGASTVLKAGGAQAVSAMAYGTKTCPKVDKIFGPGNQWVTAAKMLVQNDTDALVSIDMPAGPSEVLVIADYTANPAFVAADLLSQAEHGVDSQVILVAVDLTREKLAAIENQLDEQALALPRVEILRQSIPKSIIVKVQNIDQAIEFSNDYAPEHLILHLENPSSYLPLIDNAGSVFVGPFTPESCGDYASGTNHTLPTNGYARQFSGVNTQSFQKHITSQEITHVGLQTLGPVVATLADCEGLQAHANAVRIRLQ
ncbi:hypothetical protein M378DRAFT_121099 [Amanita muscaria Koide BX008]|uniref:Histidine biosynthesis trifunctional protein n=1 Tax=Amanita muscaria (strain Koide BX008) TaxID=946122 RepID=A0A0C2X1Q9_AMAMK|nr:hypothetical protein M378DRAFT_121099 [Amanita muscaria Koide BX008]